MAHQLAPHLRPATEAEIEAALRDVLLRGGFYPVKTDAAMINRGSRGRGSIRTGFPDLTVLHPLPGTTLCLAALVETKTVTGKLRQSQIERHAELRDLYGLQPLILRDPKEAVALIREARRIAGLLKERSQIM
ncbi:hypothetical protein [Deinococcus phoenicis]|nr:hypothetical protein [Deinococcus phoenicis]